jgi:hypothetical protein
LTLTFNDKTKVEFTRDKGQVYLNIPIVCEGSTDGDSIEFIYDTGAYITVINRERYENYGLDKLPRRETSIGGYVGLAPGYVFQIPGLIIGNKLLSGVWAFTPISMEIKQNLLGDNVIEYFRPFQDNLHSCLYFLDNPNPKPFESEEPPFSLACDSILFVEGIEK